MPVSNKLVDEVKKLLDVASELIGPNGCPWDKKQTLYTVRDHMIEEYAEYLDALDANDKENIIEELGDVFFQACFLLLIAQKENLFQSEEPVVEIREKLIRRHPHVFGDANISSEEELVKQWDAIKAEEKSERKSQSPLDRIPASLPPLQRGKEMASIIRKDPQEIPAPQGVEEELGKKIFEAIQSCDQVKVSPEGALRSYLKRVENTLRSREATC